MGRRRQLPSHGLRGVRIQAAVPTKAKLLWLPAQKHLGGEREGSTRNAREPRVRRFGPACTAQGGIRLLGRMRLPESIPFQGRTEDFGMLPILERKGIRCETNSPCALIRRWL